MFGIPAPSKTPSNPSSPPPDIVTGNSAEAFIWPARTLRRCKRTASGLRSWRRTRRGWIGWSNAAASQTWWASTKSTASSRDRCAKQLILNSKHHRPNAGRRRGNEPDQPNDAKTIIPMNTPNTETKLDTPETDHQEFDEANNFDVDWPSFARSLERSRNDWHGVAERLAAALKQLNAIYRADCDEPGPNPPWLSNALAEFERLRQSLPSDGSVIR